MPSDGVKQRKGKIATSNNGETTETPKPCGGDGEKKDGDVWGKTNPRSLVDIRTVVSLVSLSACFLLAWAVLQQNARFDEVEEKYRHLYEKASDLLALENKFSAASKKLEASEDHLKGALSSLTMLTALQQETSFLNSIVTAMQEDQHASSHRLKRVNERFLNVTETWQGGLNTVTEDLTMLRSESRSVHGRVTERVNEAEESLRALAKRLEELEDSTKRNGRALERTEEDDAKSVQSQLDWNTKQVSRLQEQFGLLSKRDVEFEEKLVEMEPQAKECETHLPAVEDAVRSILRLGADLSGAERRLEELTLQVVGTEDSMLKTLTDILALKQTLNDLQVDNSVMKVRNELSVVLDTMKELKHIHNEEVMDSGREEPKHEEGKQLNLQSFKGNQFVESTEVPSSTAGDEEIPLTELNKLY
ncbi:inhibitor of nuclear factor kappa-B kinase-interacting protein isoform X1 [Silurus meridionalis]|uniref:inhibitor of nuclear factor kappa-B kinase-interacting protein isoform X1 n=1 Tax=Silurus meridionalis TaxID=175797 RepID=UPI001EE9ECF7|nr:inhibitor of nuclear factor kappa-B kinase-interacting protein isoform X1 [Silurus meridionalis]